MASRFSIVPRLLSRVSANAVTGCPCGQDHREWRDGFPFFHFLGDETESG
jgi:hypothetical protein